MSAYTNPAPYTATAVVAARPELSNPVADATAMVRLPVLSGTGGQACGSEAEDCATCAGAGVSLVTGAPAPCVCCEEAPTGIRADWEVDPRARVYRAEPCGMVRVYPVGSVWASAAEILAVVFDHFGQLADTPAPGQNAAGWVRQAAAEVLHPARQQKYQTDTATSLAWLREQLDPDSASEPPVDRLTAQDTARLHWLAALVAEAFGPTGLALPPVAE